MSDMPSSVDIKKYWDVDHTAYGPTREEPLGNFARATAHRLSAAHALIPAVTHHARADITALEEFRASLKSEVPAGSVKVTLLPFVAFALARALQKFPRFNASLNASGDKLIVKEYVHIGIAVDTKHGLAVPVIRDADRKGIRTLAAEMTDIAGRARARQIRPDEIGGASTTITNLGSIGGMGFTPIINPPELTILGMSRTETVAIWRDDVLCPATMLPLDMTYDHRAINGAEAARFIEYLCAMIADPRRMLI